MKHHLKPNNLKAIIVDTPNPLFYHKHRGEEQIRKNLMALMCLVTSGIGIIATLTPKMYRYDSQIVKNLEIIIRTKGGQAIPVWDKDPDVVVLELSMETKFPILTNDKFKQNKYKQYPVNNIIRYDVIENRIKPRNKFWNNYVWGSSK